MSQSFSYVPEILNRKKVIELIEQNSFSSAIVVTRPCDVSVAIGDLVLNSGTNDDNVETAVDNNDIRPVVGIVIGKDTTTTANVMLLGEFTGATGLVPGNKIFLNTDGTLTSTVVGTGYLQCLGAAKSTTSFTFSPQIQRVKRS